MYVKYILTIPITIVFIDLSKAFDNINHQSLILLLQQCGIEGVALTWLYNCLKWRTQKLSPAAVNQLPFHVEKVYFKVA